MDYSAPDSSPTAPAKCETVNVIVPNQIQLKLPYNSAISETYSKHLHKEKEENRLYAIKPHPHTKGNKSFCWSVIFENRVIDMF